MYARVYVNKDIQYVSYVGLNMHLYEYPANPIYLSSFAASAAAGSPLPIEQHEDGKMGVLKLLLIVLLLLLLLSLLLLLLLYYYCSVIGQNYQIQSQNDGNS